MAVAICAGPKPMQVISYVWVALPVGVVGLVLSSLDDCCVDTIVATQTGEGDSSDLVITQRCTSKHDNHLRKKNIDLRGITRDLEQELRMVGSERAAWIRH
jgi:hypothetical protein